MKMLQDQIPEGDKLHLWKLFKRGRSAGNGVNICKYKCLISHQSDCRTGLHILRGNGFEQLERCGSYHLDSHVHRAMRTRDTEEDDDDLDYPNLGPDDSYNEDEQSKEEEEEKEEKSDSGTVSDTDTGLLGGNSPDYCGLTNSPDYCWLKP
jgi:hypothetical protein